VFAYNSPALGIIFRLNIEKNASCKKIVYSTKRVKGNYKKVMENKENILSKVSDGASAASSGVAGGLPPDGVCRRHFGYAQ
jgi:hypothetical protein